MHVCGHIHEDYGVTSENGTVFINAACCNVKARWEPARAWLGTMVLVPVP